MTITNRTNERIKAVTIIYEALFNDKNLGELISEERFSDLEKGVLDFLNLVVSNYDEILLLIRNNMVKYTPERLNLTDYAILILGTAELMAKKTPKAIIISEALKISEIYTKTEKDNTVRFNNKVLENIAISLGY